MPHVLVISPERSHPQNQGNNNRIYRFARALQELGATVHFLYCNHAWIHNLSHYRDMQDCWDHLHFVNVAWPAKQRSFSDHYHIDDWYEPLLTPLVRRLCAQWNFSACIVNYVWFSKALEAVPAGVHKIIDTHDVFGNRADVCRQAGFAPDWYYTTPEQERRGLSRADTIIAIQPAEAAYYRSLFSGDVREIGYLTPFTPLPRRAKEERPRIGYLASGNPFNVAALRAFEEAALRHWPEAKEQADFVLGGQICDVVGDGLRLFRATGRVDTVADFYRDVEMVLNPMAGGTGLKIKTLEAMAYNRPVLGTPSAFVGIPVDEAVICRDLEDLALRLRVLAGDRERLDACHAAAVHAYEIYVTRQHENLTRFYDECILSHAI